MLKGVLLIHLMLLSARVLLHVFIFFSVMVGQLLANFFCRTGMAGVPGTASDIFGAVRDAGANVIMISQVIFLIISVRRRMSYFLSVNLIENLNAG